MIRIIVQWQDQFGKWHRFQEKRNATDAEALGSVVTAWWTIKDDYWISLIHKTP